MTDDRARVLAIDWMRGLVMVLMALDHAGAVFNEGHLVTDSRILYRMGAPLPAADFLTRWLTHLCAPTFLFLSGTSLALSEGAHRRRGGSAWAFDRYLVVRGAILIALDPTLVTLSWKWMHPNPILVQVLSAIGGGLIVMALLRRLERVWLLLIAALLLVPMEAVTQALWAGGSWSDASVPVALLVAVGARGGWIFLYPLLPWLAMMILGYLLGRRLVRSRESGRGPERLLLGWGATGLAVFALVRGLNEYGNMGLYRMDGSLVQWLHVSKYPPALAFTALELGLMSLLLAGFFGLERVLQSGPDSRNPLVVLGQTALFFYLLHVPLLTLFGKVTGLTDRAGLPATYLATLLSVAILYPACLLWRRYRRARPRGWARCF